VLREVSQLPAVRRREDNLDKAGKGPQEELVRKLEKVLLAGGAARRSAA